ncbi:MAG TPA: autotransporter domain-containing protein [Caulobacteraceae bacterium]|jgi:outer membrane autotransporter protein|nr:autotransporter domain-containing protein [Caulobacteraceae bacterium]
MLTVTRSRRALLLASAVLLSTPAAALADSLTVSSGQTVPTTTSIGGTDAVVVDAGGAISVSSGAGLSWDTPATGPGVILVNNGSITAGIFDVVISGATTGGNLTITNAGSMWAALPIDLYQTSQADQPALGTETLSNTGVIHSTLGTGLAVLFGYGGSDVLNEATGGVIRGRVLDPNGNGTINLSGAGSGAFYGLSQGVDNSTALATQPGWDGFSNVNVNSGNWTLTGSSQLGGAPNYDLTIAQGATLTIDPNVEVTAFFQSGNLTINNAGAITQLNGGEGSELVFGDSGSSSGAFSGITINNKSTGVIQSFQNTVGGDGRAIAIQSGVDGLTINNAGTISAADSIAPGNGGTYAGGAISISPWQASSMPGPANVTINNLPGGVLEDTGVSSAIVIGQDGPVATRSVSNITINNQGAIIGGSGAGALAAISVFSQDPIDPAANTPIQTGTIPGIVINNTGTIDGSGSGVAIDDSINTAGLVLTNGAGGVIRGAVAFGSGDDTFNVETGSSVIGRVTGGGGTDTLNLSGPGAGTLFGSSEGVNGSEGISATAPLSFTGWDGFSVVNVNSGSWTLAGGGYYDQLNVASGATFTVADNTFSSTPNGTPTDAGIGAAHDTLAIVNDGTFVVGGSHSALSYNPSAPPPFSYAGSGRIEFSGTGTYYVAPNQSFVVPGGASISNGAVVVLGELASNVTVNPGATLQIGGGGAVIADQALPSGAYTDTGLTGNVTGAVIDNGTVVFNRLDDYDFTGAFSGNGALVKNGPGVLTFEGPYSFTGATTVNGGTIDIADLVGDTNLELDSGTLNLTGSMSFIANLTGTGGTVNVAAGDTLNIGSGDFGGDMVGGGALEKTGNATLVLSGNVTLSGPTEVAGGDLQVDGNLSSPVTVDDGASLGGAGSITGSVTVASGGTFSPGDPVTTNVIGAVIFKTGSAYLAQVTTVAADLINVSGAVTIQPGAAVEVMPLGNVSSYGRLNSYTIIRATAGVSGTFSSVTSDMPLLTPHLTYTDDTVDLSLTRNDISFASLAATRNQAAAAAAIEAGGFGTPLYMALIVQDATGSRTGYDALSGEAFASIPTVMLAQSDQTRRTLMERMDQPGDKDGVWAEATGGWGSFAGGGGVAGSHDSVGGFTLGVDGGFHGWRLGVAGDYLQDTINIGQRSSSADDQAEGVSLYAGSVAGPFAVKLGASYAWHRVDTRRSELLSGFSDRTRAGFDAGTGQVFGEIGYRIDLHDASLEPFAGLSCDEISTQRAAETGGPAALAVNGETRQVLSSRLGLRAAVDLGRTVSLHGSLAWRHASDDVDGAARVAFEGTGQDFTVIGQPIARDATEVTAGLAGRLGAHGRIDVAYSGQIAAHWQDNSVRLLAAWEF